ncbi:hypothetical protein [Bacillus sp. 1P06AnD]|uniref:hypothetical protein n=1 Tax=Bacillus sp. 1P06AnD TaxID=3132208 RepID=UPI0039A058FE
MKSKWKKRIVALLTVIVLVCSILIFTKVRINAEMNEKPIVVSKIDIPPRTEITEDMLETIVVPTKSVPSNAASEAKDIIGTWTKAGYGIPAHSYIYDNKVTVQDKMPDAGILELKEGEVAFPLLVDLETSLGNSIIPDTKVDLYFRSLLKDEDSDKALYGKLASQVRVVSVKNADAANVFDPDEYSKGTSKEADGSNKANFQTEENSMAKIYIFAVPSSLNELLNKAKLLGEIVPIATGKQSKKDLTDDLNDVKAYIYTSSYKNSFSEKDVEKATASKDSESEGI